MTFNFNTKLFREFCNKTLVKSLLCGLVAFNTLGGPDFAVAANPTSRASEYEEWGLDYPGKGAQQGSEAPVKQPAPQNPPALSPASNPSDLMGGTVPQDIASSVEQATVQVIVFYADGKHMVMPGWIVDTERRIILTFALLKNATAVQVAYPQVPSRDKDSLVGSPAVILKYDSKMDVAYLQAKSMPQELVHLTPSNAPQGGATPQRTVSHKPAVPVPPVQGGHNGGQFQGNGNGGYTPPQQQSNPLVGKWYLQDNLNGVQIQIAVAFGARGEFAMEVVAVDSYGQQNYDSDNGTYRVNGNTLVVNTSDGVEQSKFWFENGVLYVQLVANGTTMAFQKVS
ncbi:hypothetical protein [Gimesia sp.]|uniref:hypothetical protein n=1 Tax=Gimesia sp. TaxID=2024833 RepID=UPI003A8D6CBC